MLLAMIAASIGCADTVSTPDPVKCADGQSVCGGICVDTRASVDHCGTCETACAVGQTCSSGGCAACGAGLAACGGACANLAVDPANCGACGVVCGATEFCAKPSACTACAATDLGNTVPQTTTGATIGEADQFDSFCGTGNAPDVRYQLTAPAAATYTFDTLGSAFNTVLEVRDGGCAGPRLGCNDDSGGVATSKVTLPLTQGQIVTIFIDGRLGSQGSYPLHIN